MLLALSLVLGLAACGTKTELSTTQEDRVTLQSAPEAPVVEEPVKPETDDVDTQQATQVEENVVNKENSQPSQAVSSLEQPQPNSKEPEKLNQTLNTGNVQDTATQQPVVSTGTATTVVPAGAYTPGVVLVKVKEAFDQKDAGTLEYTSAAPIYHGSKWYRLELSDAAKTDEAVTYLTERGTFASVDFDYVMGVNGTKEDAAGNPNYDQQVNLGLSNIPNGWTVNGKAPGGSPDVVIAVIDTGVDYHHPDLCNNIWVNTAEIPDNGKDDDGNGYIDDLYGWDCVGNDNSPMDDNGHGTHVAGIIAAENNKEGGIGVAYNCKVMVLKAGNSSGYFNNSDIAEAIQYAYMNGASVINMSFGGSQISIAVEEALENAYNTCVLVAAAGNEGACNNLGCSSCEVKAVSYPAALPYVIGVMSTEKDGKHISSFSNYDHNPYDSVEYEVYAVGEGVGSTWPSDKYACLSGTSMASPTVAGIAALLRSYYTDREVYSTKFIQSQIVNTGTVYPHILDHVTDEAHSVADAAEALTKLPKPSVNLYDYHIDDSVSISAQNNGNGVIDAGETVRLYIALHNRGGVASNVNVSIDTYRRELGDETMTDPYVTLVNTTMELSDIGTYSVRESGQQYFEIQVSGDCPNDYLVDFNIRYTYTNGMDDKDKTQYADDGKQKARFHVSRGYRLPSVISENTTFTNDRLYIVATDVVVPEGITVTFEEGCRIQFYDDKDYVQSPEIKVYGTLLLNGTKENMISIAPSTQYDEYACIIDAIYTGNVQIRYADTINLVVKGQIDNYIKIENSYIDSYSNTVYSLDVGTPGYYVHSFSASEITGSYINMARYGSNWIFANATSNYMSYGTYNNTYVSVTGNFSGNIVYSWQANDDIPCEIYIPYDGYESKPVISNNLFLAQDDNNIKTLPFFNASVRAFRADNTFSAGYQKYADQVFSDYFDREGNAQFEVYGACSDISAVYPHVVSVELFNADGAPITTVGMEEITVRVTFNRPMDTTRDTFVTFGTMEPYADYRIDGSYVSDTVWEGTYTIKAQMENGVQKLRVNGAYAADDAEKPVYGENQLVEFNIDTTVAMSMNLFAAATDSGIELTWKQDDYDTLMGYNIYRADSKDGNYVKINPSVLLSTDSSFLDDNAEPGKTYWYTFTVVLSDFSESAPAGKVFCTAVDTLSPTIYHTPVNQGYAENNLVISCTASDNMAIAWVTLYYRAAGSDTWKSLPMSKVNDKYSATIFGSELSLEGMEYYLLASDGTNTVSKGTQDAPYQIVIKDASSLSRIGDVDGSGNVTTKDALMLMQCLNGDLLLEDDAFHRADLNSDGQLSSAEALRILQYVNGKVTTLEM